MGQSVDFSAEYILYTTRMTDTFAEQRDRYFPKEVVPGVTVRPVSMDAFFDVTGRLADSVFTPLPSLGLMPFNPTPEQLRRSFSRHTEQFVFYDAEDRPIGWSYGEQREGDTFFMGWTGILPAWQRKGLYGNFLKQLQSYIRELGFARITSNHMVNNRSVLIAKLKADFIITGMSMDERFGAVVWLTWFCEQERAEGYEKAFSLPDYR